MILISQLGGINMAGELQETINYNNGQGQRRRDLMIPEDRGNLVYLTQFLFGMALLLPFNMIIACIDFYESKMPGFYPASTYPFAL